MRAGVAMEIMAEAFAKGADAIERGAQALERIADALAREHDGDHALERFPDRLLTVDRPMPAAPARYETMHATALTPAGVIRRCGCCGLDITGAPAHATYDGPNGLICRDRQACLARSRKTP